VFNCCPTYFLWCSQTQYLLQEPLHRVVGLSGERSQDQAELERPITGRYRDSSVLNRKLRIVLPESCTHQGDIVSNVGRLKIPSQLYKHCPRMAALSVLKKRLEVVESMSRIDDDELDRGIT